ncbi:MAG: hypothetical protein VKM17_00185 [Cyanobacteriota bacterium]|nr:hypothetical protein [Cyanobacteriota bacterium]
MATAPVSPSPLCRPEEDPCLLLQATLHTIRSILDHHRGQPLPRFWMDRPYGEEEITRMEEEVLPALQRFVARIAVIDQSLLVEMESRERCRLEEARIQLAKLRPVLG